MTKAPELLPCPFCGGEGEIVDAVESGEQAKVVCCRKCMASSRVIFALMDDVTFDLVSAWNARTDHALALVAAENEACAGIARGFPTLANMIFSRSPDDATAALKARDQRTRNEALREALAFVPDHTDDEWIKSLRAPHIKRMLAVAKDRISALITEGQSDGE